MKTLVRAISLILVAVMMTAVFASCANDTPATTDNDTTTAADAASSDTVTEEVTTEAATDEQTEPDGTTEEVTTEEAEEPNPDITDLVVREQSKTVEISTREQLFAFARHMIDEDENYDFSDYTILLTDDINLDPSLEGGKNWVPMIASYNLTDATFDGQGHTINGITIEPEDLEVVGSNGNVYGTGFFAIVNVPFTIKNVNFTNAQMTASSTKHCGGVVGSVETNSSFLELANVTVSGLVLNGGIGVEGDISTISIRIGGLVGANIEGGQVDIHDCTVDNTQLYGFHNISGIIGCSNEGTYTIENNTVKNTQFNYSASYANNENYKNPVYSRYFADPFYCENNYWGEYHTDYDLEQGNKYENLDFYDIRNDIHYKNEEGKDKDCEPNEEGEFPAVKGSIIRPRDEREY